MHMKSTQTRNYAHRSAQDKTKALFLIWNPCEFQRGPDWLAAVSSGVWIYLLGSLMAL